MIAFPCPSCDYKLKVKDEFAGKNGTCPRCKSRVKIPPADASTGNTETGAVSSAPVALPQGRGEALAQAAQAIQPPPPPDLTEDATVPPQSSGDATQDATVPPRGHTVPCAALPPEELDFLAPAEGPDEMGRLGGYRVLKVLGAGGMGMVLHADDPLLKRSVAIKVMRPELAARQEARERFLREAQLTAAIEHEHIVHVYQVGQDRGVPFLAMPFLKGQPLDSLLERGKRLEANEVIDLGRQIAEGLSAAHERGLIHRDVKPANIWLEARVERGRAKPRHWVKILDFGLARALADDAKLTQTGAIMGTPAYMAPEQARGEAVDAKCDLFSLGAVLYRMLTGQQPFKGSDSVSMLVAVVADDPQPIQELSPNVPPRLAALVMKLLEKDPSKRPPSARAVADSLAGLEEDKTVRLPPRPVRPAPVGANKWLLAATGALLVLVLAGLGWFFFSGSGGKEDSTEEKPAEEKPAELPDGPGVITNSLGMKLKEIQPGRFWVGSPRTEIGRKPNEQEHEISLTRPFFIGVHEVTVGQFRAFVNATGYNTEAERSGEGSRRLFPDGEIKMDDKLTWKSPGYEQSDSHPVTCVSWHDAVSFCRWLTEKERRVYALPSEAQWEYCCRAGFRTRFPASDEENALPASAWYSDNSDKQPHPVGQKKPNAWGLYDMHGNVREWCADGYTGVFYFNSPREDPWNTGSDVKLVRGGSWREGAVNCRAAARAWQKPGLRGNDTGFRVMIQPEVIVVNSIGMKLRKVNTTPARFQMGSPKGDPGSDEKSELRHRVTLDKPFFIGLHEVTVGQFKAFVEDSKYQTDAERSGKGSKEFFPPNKWKANPKINWKNPGFEQTDDHPVVCVSWKDAMAFCTWLSKKEGQPYSLPTEAQWEYCYRARSSTRFPFGNDDKELENYAWYQENSGKKAHPVGQKKPNGWCLFDMGGNAWEWCRDWYSPDYNPKGPPNPTGPAKGSRRVTRGGGWAADRRSCRSAHRGSYPPADSNSNVGFRVVQLPAEVVSNSLGMKLKLMPTGTFTMGSPINEPGRQPDEEEHDVTLARPFYMGIHKVTVKQFRAFVEATKHETSAETNNRGAFQRQPDGKWKRISGVTWRKPGFEQGDDHPVVCVSQRDAQAFCDWLSKKEGRTYVLPTEAQWEYCCRAGWKTRFSFGDDERMLGQFAWFLGNSGLKTHPVGKKKPNAWGLYDMHGNAEEITGDWYGSNYYKKGTKVNPPGPLMGQKIVIRGSGWAGPPSDSRAARRMGRAGHTGSGGHHGFRVVLLW